MSRSPTKNDYALAADLAKIYMQKQPSQQETPSEFAKRFLNASSQIFQILLTGDNSL